MLNISFDVIQLKYKKENFNIEEIVPIRNQFFITFRHISIFSRSDQLGTIFKAIEKLQQTIKNELNPLDSFETGTLSSNNGIDPMLVTYFEF